MTTEDGEIDEGTSAEYRRKEDEIEKYYLALNVLGKDLRCTCCGDVYSDPVKLKCLHLIDRSCAVIKRDGNSIACPICHVPTECEDVDQLLTDFNSASQIPPKPDSLLEVIHRHGGHLLKLKQNQNSDSRDANGDCYGRPLKDRKRKRKSRWDTVEDVPKTSFTDAIMDILSSHDLPKNITMSQFKKFSEVSNKSSIMSLLTKAVLQKVNDKVKRKNCRKSDAYSDSDILEMMSSYDLKDLFELEKIQLILLYRDALDKGAIVPQLSNKLPKYPLLPTPSEVMKTVSDFSPESPKPEPLIEFCDSDFCTHIPNSNFSDESESYPKKKLKTKPPKLDIVDCEPERTKGVEEDKTLVDPKPSKEHRSVEVTKVTEIIDENVQYRQNVARLHSIYSNMYHASLKMKEFETQIQSPDYQCAYKTYSENYAEYQTLYSSLQAIGSLNSGLETVIDNPESSSPYDNNGVCTDGAVDGVLSAVHCQEQASSTISPITYAPDSTESFIDSNKQKLADNQLHLSTNVRSRMSPDGVLSTKQTPTDNSDKYGYLWISNLSKDTRTSDLCQLFGKFGHVSKVKLFQYNAHSPMTYYSLIFMPNVHEAELAQRDLHNTTFFDQVLHVKMLDNDPLSDDRPL